MHEPSYPRKQAQRLAGRLAREHASLRAVVAGRRWEGKSDLLRQVHEILFHQAEGPMPFLYSLAGSREGPEYALGFAAAFCQQMRAFLMRQEEMLGEPAGELQKELERPGLPLSLTELGRELLHLPPERQVEAAAGLPALFVHREGRPVCQLLDDGEAAGEPAPYLSGWNRPGMSVLLSGRAAAVTRIAGRRGWMVIELEPFSLREAFEMAEDQCRGESVRFSREAWEDWFDVAGTSPAWMSALIQAAANRDLPLETAEDIGELYVHELARGSIGHWMSARLEAGVAGRREQARVAGQLAALGDGRAGPAADVFPDEVCDRLIAEEWLQVSPTLPVARLERVERDWLELAASATDAASSKAQALALRSFLMQVRVGRKHRERADALEAVREHLLSVEQGGRNKILTVTGEQIGFPPIGSVATVRTAGADLFWCYGFRPGGKEDEQAPYLLLIAFCWQAPSAASVKQWLRELEQESRRINQPSADEAAKGKARTEAGQLWVVVPENASLVAASREQRLRWDEFVTLLEVPNPDLKTESTRRASTE